MTAVDLPVRKGNSESFTFAFKNSDGSAFDLTDSTILFFAEKADGTLMTKTTAGDTPTLTMSTPTNGQVTLALTPAETSLFTIGRANKWEIERRISGSEKTLMEGYMVVTDGLNTDA